MSTTKTEQTAKNSFNTKWITDKPDKEMVRFCDQEGEYLKKKKISSSQLRNIYGEIIRIKLKGYKKMETEFLLLKPKIAYNASRLNNDSAKNHFKNFMTNSLFKAMDAVSDERTFLNFQKFFEAILAYHKYHGGK